MSNFEQLVFKMWISENKTITKIAAELSVKESVIRKAIKK